MRTESLGHRGDLWRGGPAQVATAWAIAKGTLPIIGVTKVSQADEAVKAAQINLNADEISRLERLANETGIHTLREWEKRDVIVKVLKVTKFHKKGECFEFRGYIERISE